MNAEVRQYLDAAVYRMTLPIARFLLRFGMTANEFGNLCRSAFVRAAAEEFERAGKKPNQSRIAVRTGLHRREVKTYLENDWKEVRNHEWHRHRTTRVLSGWHQDPDFVDKNGQPIDLPFDGQRTTFEMLCQRYSGDIGPRAMLKELERIQAVELQPDGRLRVLTRSYQSQEVDEQALMHFADAVHDLVATLDLNLQPDQKRKLFEGVAGTPRLNPKMLPLFRRRVADRGQKFLDLFDEWLSREEVSDSECDTDGIRVGVGIYVFEEDDAETPSDQA